MQKTILITGGTGLVGQALCTVLKEKGHTVRILSRQPTQIEKGIYNWDLKNNTLDVKALENLDCVVHLAGANVFGARWTKQYKEEILNSRVDGLNLLFSSIKKKDIKPHIISASGSNYYSSDIRKTYSEENPAGTNFLSTVCIKWEKAAEQFKEINCPVSIVRTSAVLSKNGGAFKQLKTIFKTNLGASLGSGKQIFAWVHITDLVNIYLNLIEGQLAHDTYNVASPAVTTMDNFSKKLADKMGKWLIPINVPSFLLKAILGSRAQVLLEGGALRVEKIENAGYTFTYPNLAQALQELVD